MGCGCNNNRKDVDAGTPYQGAPTTLWGAIQDRTVVYTGTEVKIVDIHLVPGMNLLGFMNQTIEAFNNLQTGVTPVPFPPIPSSVYDPLVTFETTAEYLNETYPDAVLNQVVHNGTDSKFTKRTLLKWEYEIMDLR